MTVCGHMREYISEERESLQTAIEENKWYLSERAGHDVGRKAAEWDFINHHIDAFADHFRAAFCGQCKCRGDCLLCERVVMKAALALS